MYAPSYPAYFNLINNIELENKIYVSPYIIYEVSEVRDWPNNERINSYEEPYKGHQKSLKNLLMEESIMIKGLRRYFKYTPAELIKKINDAFDSCKHEVPEDSLFYISEYYQTMLMISFFLKLI